VEPLDTLAAPRILAGIIAAFALALSVPFGRLLLKLSHRNQLVTASFAAGVSLACVLVDLLIELTYYGSAHVHSLVPIGRTYEQSLFAVVLAGALAWYSVDSLAARRPNPRARYRAYVVPQIIYEIFLGGALALEAENGIRTLLLLAVPMLLHLSIIEAHIHHDYAVEHHGVPRILLAVAPGFAAMAWSLLNLPPAGLFLALALIAGSTVVQVIQTELPTPAVARLGPFITGAAVYVVMVVARWRLGE
jgi:hypothetical protein